MNKQGKSHGGGMLRKMAPGLIVSAVIIGVLVYVVDFKQLANAFRSVSWNLILILFAIQSLAFVFRGLAWRVILDGKPTVIQSFFTITEGYLLNLLPLRLGEIGRAVIMGGLIKESPFYVFSTVILERLFDVFVTLIMLIATIPLVGGADLPAATYYLLFAVVIALVVSLMLIIRNQEKFIRLLGKIIKPESKIGKMILPKIESLLGGMTILAQPKKFFIWLIFILLTWVCWISSLLLTMRFFFPHLPVWAGFFVQSIGALGGAIPSAPAGLGVIEGAYVAALSFFGINQSEGLAFALFAHSLGIIIPVIYGIIGFMLQGQNFSRLFSEIQHARLTKEENEQ